MNILMPPVLPKDTLEHLSYLHRVSTELDPPLITPRTAELAAKAWAAICMESGFQVPVPAACTGPDGEMFYSWDRGRHHLELEVTPGKPAEFFYRDRETEQLWSEDYEAGKPLSPEAAEKVRLFI